ncbi:MAG: hypothetical protein F4Y14_15910 [Acidobacteria bacterium]|nr:hypothetical protein [Acidobacteriota bacterium]MYH32974.1 hypothetical protein [Gammaproteobacteria bacterium]
MGRPLHVHVPRRGRHGLVQAPGHPRLPRDVRPPRGGGEKAGGGPRGRGVRDVSELRLLGCAVLLNLGVAAVLGAGIARYMVETIPRIATVALTELVAEHAEIAANAGGSPEETAAATRAWARALENALRQVADRHGAVLLPIRGVAAGAPDLTAEVRAEIAHALAGGRVLAHGNVPAHGSVPAQDDVLADDHPATREERP